MGGNIYFLTNLRSRASHFLVGNRFFKAGIFLTALNILTGVLGYFYQISMGRMLLPQDYAQFSAILGLSMFIGGPITAFCLIISRSVSHFKAIERYDLVRIYLSKVNWIFIYFSIFSFILVLLIKSQIQKYLKIDDEVTVFLFYGLIILNLLFAFNLAFYQGLQFFIWLGVSSFLLAALKIFLSYEFVSLGLAVPGALLGTILAALLIYGYGSRQLLVFIAKKKSSAGLLKHNNFRLSTIRSVIPVLIASVGIGAMTQLDIVFVNWFYSPSEAAIYAAAAVLGKAILYLPGGLILAMYPMVSDNYAKNKKSASLLYQASLATVFFSILIGLIYWVYSDFIINVFYGDKYFGASEILKWYVFAILPISLVIVAEQFLIAQGQVVFAWVFLVITPFELATIIIWHEKISTILTIMSLYGFLLLLVGYYFTYKYLSNKPGDTHEEI